MGSLKRTAKPAKIDHVAAAMRGAQIADNLQRPPKRRGFPAVTNPELVGWRAHMDGLMPPPGADQDAWAGWWGREIAYAGEAVE